MTKGKSKLISSGPGTWGKLAGQSGSVANQGVNVNSKDYRKSGAKASKPSLSNNMNPQKTPASRYAFKGV